MNILLITPPFTQLNTPYPATPFLKGFLNQFNYNVKQVDLSIQLILKILSKKGLTDIFQLTRQNKFSENSTIIFKNSQNYIYTIEPVMNFLLYNDNSLAPLICSDNFLPRASRFNQLPDLEWTFGNLGINDKARFLATLYIEDIGDFIKENVNQNFGFSRYAEKLGMSAHSFSQIEAQLNSADNIIDQWMIELLKINIDDFNPDVIGFTIPFPGNLYGALKCGQFIKNNFTDCKVVIGGGYVNTELRSLSEPKLFDYIDFVCLDDGELPLLSLLRYLNNENDVSFLKRTFLRTQNEVIFYNQNTQEDFEHSQIGSPDYSDLQLNNYLSVIELANPMHRLWCDGRWNKLSIAHGCYWHKCAFCDTSLNYINHYSTSNAKILVDRIESIINQTRQRGFHFVDEAAPPAVLKQLAIELINRKIKISWWTNIRFEKAYTKDLCHLLAASGCIAVTGGLETASDRLLKLMNKGITIKQAALVCRNFADAGIMVHAYLMYGFPSQTVQETIDSLEIVRQFFENQLIQSAFWHLFTTTVHSEVGQNPEKFRIQLVEIPNSSFAINDVIHHDINGINHQNFSAGLSKAVYNFMHGIGYDFPLSDWFDFRIPNTTTQKHLIEKFLFADDENDINFEKKLFWIGNKPEFVFYESNKKGKKQTRAKIILTNRIDSVTITTSVDYGKWLMQYFDTDFDSIASFTVQLNSVKSDYERNFNSRFSIFLKSNEWKLLRENGLLIL